MTLKIALIGKARAGKDSVADLLAEHYGFTKYAFGTALKRYYHDIFGEQDGKPREGYQWFGQTMRERDPGVWVRKLFEEIDIDLGCEELFSFMLPIFPVITDVRQQNEYDRCRAEGYTIIRVEADDTTRLERMRAAGDRFNIDDLKHDTETQLDAFEADYTVDNGAGVTLDDLKRQVDVIMGELITQRKRIGAGRVR
ncbi:adenylate kinase [Alkalihalobacillus clausii]|uniref:AAA family ATPase n=1 Tax=Shouchella clausii TaxID=79880 RepID=UPI001C22BBEF|nr:AAA family ATPase [Shouchella clausii]MBU8597349.1 adenylate kinase [Shouchella clausii]